MKSVHGPIYIDRSNIIRVFVCINKEQKYRCLSADIQRYYFLARAVWAYHFRSVFLATARTKSNNTYDIIIRKKESLSEKE